MRRIDQNNVNIINYQDINQQLEISRHNLDFHKQAENARAKSNYSALLL